VVKARVSPHVGRGAARGAALAAHLAYLGRQGAGSDAARPSFFDRAGDELDAATATAGWAEDRRHFRFIISPEHGDRIADLRRYTRQVMQRVAEDLGQPDLPWVAACHLDTDQPHAHVVIRGRRVSGRDLFIPRDYIAYGFRARAQEVAEELLGDLSRYDAERRVWRETAADGFTGFDRRLLQAADAEHLVDDGAGLHGSWAALTRGRLQHLEALGLAARAGRRFRLDAALKARLRGLQLRQEIQRTRHQRSLETGRPVRELQEPSLLGRVVARGHHDRLGASPWLIVQDRSGVEHYVRFGFAQPTPQLGRLVEIGMTSRGAQILHAGRGFGLGG
jgi:type IV secretory pathway VirD2 relaxase